MVMDFVLSAILSASDGLYFSTSRAVTPCQMGRITFLPFISLAVNPSNSYLGQFLAKKAFDSTTIPYRDLDRPRSICAVRRQREVPFRQAKFGTPVSPVQRQAALQLFPYLPLRGNEGVKTALAKRGIRHHLPFENAQH